MDCRQTERERERGRDIERVLRRERDREQARQPPFGAMCTTCYMAIEIKIEHGWKGEIGKWKMGNCVRAAFVVSTQICHCKQNFNIMKTAWVSSHPHWSNKFSQTCTSKWAPQPNYFDNLRTCKTFNWKPRKASGKTSQHIPHNQTVLLLCSALSGTLIYDQDNYTKWFCLPTSWRILNEVQIGLEDLWILKLNLISLV